MNLSVAKFLLGDSSTHLYTLMFGIFMFLVGGALVLWRTNTGAPQMMLIMAILILSGGFLLIIGSICGYLDIWQFSMYWSFISGIGFVIGGAGCLLLPLFEFSIFTVVVGVCVGLSLIWQGISTVRTHTSDSAG